MKDLNVRSLTLMALVFCCLMQIGAQVYAVSVVASTSQRLQHVRWLKTE